MFVRRVSSSLLPTAPIRCGLLRPVVTSRRFCASKADTAFSDAQSSSSSSSAFSHVEDGRKHMLKDTRGLLQQKRGLDQELKARRFAWTEASSPASAARSTQGKEWDLTGKTPSESWKEMRLPFNTDTSLRMYFSNTFGDLRTGLLLEDLDSFAAEIAYAHADGFDRGLTIVTASLDRLELSKPLVPDQDVVFRGCVTYVGTSSMEVRVELMQLDESKASCLFTMVARNAEKAAPVPPLICKTKAERERFEQGIVNKIRRKEFARTSLMVAPPSMEERDLVHWLFLDARHKKKEGLEYVPMKSTRLTSTKIMHPQSKNIHGKIFGGYLLRQAFEMGFIASQMFCHQRPVFYALDDNVFLRPVEVGSIMQFVSTIVYQNPQSHVVRVVAQEVNPLLGYDTEPKITNVFHFTFLSPESHKRILIPETLDEANLYIEGRRIHQKGKLLSEEFLSKSIAADLERKTGSNNGTTKISQEAVE